MKCWRTLSCLIGLFPLFAFAFTDQAPKPPQAPPVRQWGSPLPFPEGATRYVSETFTQSIVVLNDADSIRRVRIRDLRDKRWHTSGGMEGLSFRSEKYRTIPVGEKVRVGIANISVKNSLGSFQNNRGVVRTYPIGTRFDDLLFNDEGDLFEHRTREKTEKGWRSFAPYRNEEARPKGYTGLKVSCASCHEEAGSGEYGEGLVPGGDTVLSDPMEWSLIRGYDR